MFLQDDDEPVGPDVRLAVVEDRVGSAEAVERLEDDGDLVVPLAARQLAVAEGPRASFAELDVRLGVEVARLPEAHHRPVALLRRRRRARGRRARHPRRRGRAPRRGRPGRCRRRRLGPSVPAAAGGARGRAASARARGRAVARARRAARSRASGRRRTRRRGRASSARRANGERSPISEIAPGGTPRRRARRASSGAFGARSLTPERR